MRGTIAVGMAAVLLTGCNNNADIEDRFQHFVKENNYEEDISHEEPPGEERVEFDLKEHISVEHYTRDTWFDRGEMQLGTRIRGPAGEKWIDDYVGLLEFSLESPDTTGFAFERMLEDLMVRGYPNSENYFTDGIHIHTCSIIRTTSLKKEKFSTCMYIKTSPKKRENNGTDVRMPLQNGKNRRNNGINVLC